MGPRGSSRARQCTLAYTAALVAALACLSLASAAQAFSASPPWQPTGRARAPLTRRAALTARSARLRRAGMSRALAGALLPAIGGPSGEIAGTVTSFTSKAPIAGIEVCAFDEEEPDFGGCGETGPTGEYELVALAPGDYSVAFFAPFNAPLSLNYITQEVKAHVSAGLSTTTNAALHAGGEITGTVTGAASAPLESIEVCALTTATHAAVRCAETDASGDYTLDGLATGKYDVEFAVSFESSANYAPQYYNGKPTLAEAEAVAVTAEQTKSPVNASLTAGGQISGTVTSAASHLALGHVEVCAFPEGTLAVFPRCAETGPTGTYDLTALASGEYELVFFPPSGEFTIAFLSEVPVTAGSTRSGENAALIPEISHEVPVAIAPPLISGTPVAGQTLSVAHGLWENEPTSYKDEWGRCGNATEIPSCHTIASGASYTLTSADVGAYIRVRESATNANGTVAAFSPATALITALPGPPRSEGLPAAPTSAPAAPPGTGVLASVTAHLSAAQINSLLLEILVPSGKNAKIGALLEHGGYSATLDVPVSGQAEIAWSALPSGARGAAARPLLLAAGRVSFSGHGAAKLDNQADRERQTLAAPCQPAAQGERARDAHTERWDRGERDEVVHPEAGGRCGDRMRAHARTQPADGKD